MSQDDKYTYPGSGGVPRNKRGLTDRDELDRAMNDYASAAWIAFSNSPPAIYDFAYLREIHTTIFGQLFDWAGQIRDVDTAAGTTGIVYARPQYVDSALEDMFGALSRDSYLQGIESPADFSNQLATHWGYLTQIHPFRDGNTRSQSLFVSNLARAAGHPIGWLSIDVDALRVARLRAVQGGESALASLLHSAITGKDPVLVSAMPGFKLDSTNSAGVAVTVTAGRCGKPRANGNGYCLRRVGTNGCPYHG